MSDLDENFSDLCFMTSYLKNKLSILTIRTNSFFLNLNLPQYKNYEYNF